MTVTLRVRRTGGVRLDLRGLAVGADAGAVERLPLVHGNRTVALAEFFDVRTGDGLDDLVLEGDCSRCDRIGWRLSQGRLVVDGPAGDYLGGGMSGGSVHARGHAGLLAGCEMTGGLLTIDGNAGDFAASTLPGSMDGMRGGTLLVKGDAGARFADRMRRGTALVFGDAGDFLASRLVAGTVGVGGRVGAHPGYGMRRGSLVFAGAAPALPGRFVPSLVDAPVFWQLLARDLARHGGPFAGLASRPVRRHLGDLAADGKGELLIPT